MFNNHNKCFLNGDSDTNLESKESSEVAFEYKSLDLYATNIDLDFWQLIISLRANANIKRVFNSGEIPLIALRSKVSVIRKFIIHNHANIVWESKTLNAFIQSCSMEIHNQKVEEKGERAPLSS